jgi:hypothetical protein
MSKSGRFLAISFLISASVFGSGVKVVAFDQISDLRNSVLSLDDRSIPCSAWAWQTCSAVGGADFNWPDIADRPGAFCRYGESITPDEANAAEGQGISLATSESRPDRAGSKWVGRAAIIGDGVLVTADAPSRVTCGRCHEVPKTFDLATRSSPAH